MAKEKDLKSKRSGKLVFGSFLILVGLIYLLNNLGITAINYGVFWPLLIIALGVVVLLKWL